MQIATLRDQERNESSRDALAPEFKSRHIPAETAKVMLEQFLGVEKKQAAPMTPQQMQMMQQMRQRNGGQPTPPKKEPEISIVANSRQNSVLIRAPIDRIAVATEFIHRIDVPGQSMLSLSDIESRVEVFRLYSLDPEKLIEIIGEMNVLEPSTRIRADDSNGALIVSGSAADRYVIERLIKRLDGSGRQFEVLQLRRLNATEVAESIAFLMGKEQEKEDSNPRRYYYYGFGGNQQDDSGSKDEFRVAANERFRQVMLWANESEMEQVRNLLVKLGELPPPGGSRSTIRRIDASSSPETYDYLLRLQQQWNQISQTPLELPGSSQFVDPLTLPDSGSESDADVDDDADTDAAQDDRSDDAPAADDDSADAALDLSARHPRQGNRIASIPAAGPERQLVGTTATATDDDATSGNDGNGGVAGPSGAATPGAAGESPQRSQIQSAADFDRFFAPSPNDGDGATEQTANSADATGPTQPIQIQLDAEGNLLLIGSDTKALDRLENLMLQVAPPSRPYHVFKIKHQTAGYIQLNLEEYFEDREEEDSDGDSFFRWYYGGNNSSGDDKPTGLGKNNELRFVYDPDTNTIVVSGATPSQLKTIGELIELWDVAEPVNKRSMRYTKLVQIEFGRAEDIAETVKEAYRDLLSSNDKTFAKGGRGGPGGGPGGGGGEEKSSGRERTGSGLIDSENGRDGGDVDFSFKGKLSLGIDETGNTLLVSAEGEPLLELVVDMIGKLDRAAKPAGDMRILSLSGRSGGESIDRILRAFGRQAASSPPTPPRGPRRRPTAGDQPTGAQP